jgi:hypothetical protein
LLSRVIDNLYLGLEALRLFPPKSERLGHSHQVGQMSAPHLPHDLAAVHLAVITLAPISAAIGDGAKVAPGKDLP